MEFTPPYNLLHYLHCLHIGRFACIYCNMVRALWQYGFIDFTGGLGDVGDCYDYERTCGAKKNKLTMRART